MYDANDPWGWWKAALRVTKEGRSEMIGSAEIPVNDEPQQGYYRMREHQGGPFAAVAYWYDGGALKCLVNGKASEEASARGRWTYCARNPVTYDAYNAYMESRKNSETPKGIWFDEVQVKGADGEVQSSLSSPKAEEAAEPMPTRRRGRPRKVAEPAAEPVVEQAAPEPEVAPAAAEPIDDWDDPAPVTTAPAAAPAAKAAPAQTRYFVDKMHARLVTAEDGAEIPSHWQEVSQDRYEELQANEQRILAQREAAAKAAIAPEEPAFASTERNERAVIGDNSSTPFEQTRDDIFEWIKQAEKLLAAGTPKTKDAADKLADVQTKLLDLRKAANEMRLGERKPLQDQLDAIQARFVAIFDKVDPIVSKLKAGVGEFITAENARRKAAAEEENRRRQEEFERQREAARDFGDAPPDEPPPREVQAQGVKVGGRRAVSAVKQRVAVIDDPVAAMAYFANQKPLHEDFAVVLKKLGKKAMDAGVSVPGMSISTNTGVR